MDIHDNIKEKILALLIIILLFFFVGFYFMALNINDKIKTTTLKNKVLQLKEERESIHKLTEINLATSTKAEVTSQSFLTLAITDSGLKKVLNQKNPDWALPIASISKLMTAVIVLENINPETEIKATRDYVGLEESAFVLEDNKIYTAKELLANMLISSDNDSARLLSGTLGEKNFIDKMNSKAKELGMDKTYFVNVTGLDPQKPITELNISSPNNLADLIIYIKNKHPEILKLTANPSYNFCDIKNYCKLISSTDKLLTDNDFKFKIIGGKTGSTDLALKNLALLTTPLEGVSLINIVLGSKDNFADTVSLINQIIINK